MIFENLSRLTSVTCFSVKGPLSLVLRLELIRFSAQGWVQGLSDFDLSRRPNGVGVRICIALIHRQGHGAV